MRHITLAIAVVLAAAGCGSARQTETTAAGSSRLPGVVRVICGEEKTTVTTPRVRTHRDGVHFLFVNRAGMDEFWMRGVDHPNENHGGFLRKPRQRDVASHEPGHMWVACFERDDHPPFYEHDPRYAEFEIVDEANLWIPWQVACDEPESFERRRVEGVRNADDAERWIRENYDIPEDAVRVRPGYPKTQWKGDPWVIVHDDATIVNFGVYRERPNEDDWRLTADICS